MNVDIKVFQKRYALSNRAMAQVCQCSLPTIQKWRSGEVTPSGSAQQLMRLLDYSAKGDPAHFRDLLGSMNRQIEPVEKVHEEDIEEFENSVSKVVNRLELMLEGRRKDKELAESEARYRSMVEARNDPVCRWLPDTTLTYANNTYAAMFSRYGDNLIGRKWIDFVPENRRSAVMTLVSDIVRRGETEVSKHESIDKDGNIQIHEWRDIPILDDKGNVVELHSIGLDQTELISLRRSLKAQRKVTGSLMSICDHPILVFDGEGRFLDMNDRFRQQVLANEEWTCLKEMIPALGMGRFKRLLERLSEKGQMLYRMKFGERIFGVKIRQLAEDKYLALYEPLDDLRESSILQVRLSKEVIVGGEPISFNLGKKALATLRRQLHQAGNANKVDRVYVFTFDDESGMFDNILEWHADGVEGHLDNLQRIPQEEYPWWMKRLRKKQWITVEDVNGLPRTAKHERDILTAQDIRAVLVAPLERDGAVCGFIGFDQNHVTRVWHSQETEALEELKGSIENMLDDLLEAAQVPEK